MRYAILLAPRAVEDLGRLRAHIRSEVKDALKSHLRHEPRRQSRSRIKRLKGIAKPQYRLRVGDVRVSYDVSEDSVEILAILEKREVSEWLKQSGRHE